MRLDQHVCDNHAALAGTHEELFDPDKVPRAIGTLIQVDSVPVDLCQECMDTVPLGTVLANMLAVRERAGV